MAVVKTLTNSVLRIQLHTGVNTEGDPIYRNRSFSNVKANALDQDLFDVADVLAGLQQHTLVAVMRVDNAQLTEG